MDLTNTTTKRNSNLKRLQKTRSTSFDDDDLLSHNSSSSFNAIFAAASDDTELQSPVSVRDMIRRYDTVAKLGNKDASALSSPLQQKQQQLQQQKQPKHNLAAMKSAYFGMNKFDTQSATTTTNRFPLRQYVARTQEDITANNKSMQTHQHKKGNSHNTHSGDRNNNNKSKSNCKLSDNSFVMQKKADSIVDEDDDYMLRERRHASLSDSENIYVADHTRRTSRSPMRDLNGVSSSLQALPTTDVSTSEATEGIEEANLHPMETSYQSKTTIAKTAAGVRIIIDIFFDQEHQPVSATDVVGSRVETDIPQSRILNEFQQQAAAAELTN
ncbi:uncharacterized protein [Eurosta solidaginis]|uniref:uncharacterized protein n=1 Tax=Eurosta solidaginis TaxID=178769 RepID=UPI00353160C7